MIITFSFFFEKEGSGVWYDNNIFRRKKFIENCIICCIMFHSAMNFKKYY